MALKKTSINRTGKEFTQTLQIAIASPPKVQKHAVNPPNTQPTKTKSGSGAHPKQGDGWLPRNMITR